MRLIGWLIGGFVIYLAATGQLMNYVGLALTPNNPQPTSGGTPSGLSGSVLNQVIPSIVNASGSGAGVAGATGTSGAASAIGGVIT